MFQMVSFCLDKNLMLIVYKKKEVKISKMAV